MKDNYSLYDLASAFPVAKINPCTKQNTIRVAVELLSQETKYTGANTNLILNQLKSISRIFWVIQFSCFGAFILNFYNMEELKDAQILFLTVVPVMTFYILPELLKSQLYNTNEIEDVCFVSAAKSFAIKIVLVSSSNILIIGIVALALGFCHQFNIPELLCRGFIPFNISIALTVIAFDFIKITSPYIMLSVSALLTLALIQMRNFAFLLNRSWLSIYFASVGLLLLAIMITAIRFKHIKEYCYGA